MYLTVSIGSFCVLSATLVKVTFYLFYNYQKLSIGIMDRVISTVLRRRGSDIPFYAETKSALHWIALTAQQLPDYP